MKLVIVGGVAGGASAAARARRLSESAEIVMFERGRRDSGREAYNLAGGYKTYPLHHPEAKAHA